jgi:hypothetical protein
VTYGLALGQGFLREKFVRGDRAHPVTVGGAGAAVHRTWRIFDATAGLESDRTAMS